MKYGLRITFRGAPSLDHVTEYIEKKYARLRKKRSDIVSCHVVIDHPHRSQRSGNDYRVSVDLSVPGKEVFARSRQRDADAGTDIFQAVNEAFGALQRQLRAAKRKKANSGAFAVPTFGFEEAVDVDALASLA